MNVYWVIGQRRLIGYLETSFFDDIVVFRLPLFCNSRQYLILPALPHSSQALTRVQQMSPLLPHKAGKTRRAQCYSACADVNWILEVLWSVKDHRCREAQQLKEVL